MVGSGKTHWSASVFELLGYPPFSVKPTLKRFLKHVLPDQRDEARIFFEQAGQGRGYHILVQVDTKSLGPRTVSIHVDKGHVEKGLEEKKAMRPRRVGRCC